MKRFKNLLLFVSVWCGLLAIAFSAPAQTWTLADTLTGVSQNSSIGEELISVASSADGNKLVATVYFPENPFIDPPYSPFYTSTNSGKTWDPNFPSIGFVWWTQVSSSADGTKLVASSGNGGWIYTSTNSGIDWIQTSAPSEDWYPIASSADGAKLVAVAQGGPICTSTNAGATWIQQTIDSSYSLWSSVASSADGTKIAATAYSDTIYVSTNSGVTWTATTAPIEFWQSVASSADGNKLIAAVAGGQIYTSTNAGITWAASDAPNTNWQSVAASADGTKLVAAVWGGQIYTSTNAGGAWAVADVPSTNWMSVATSADGSKSVAIVDSGQIYTSYSTPSPSMNIAPTNDNLILSWLVPSTSFVMQQSFDLTSWTDMTNQPVLNLTNLQNKMILSPSGSNVFYRLKTP
jgi:hypothetical protein